MKKYFITTFTIKTKTYNNDKVNIPSLIPGTICLSTISCTINGCAIEKGVINIDKIIDHQNKFLKGCAMLNTRLSKTKSEDLG